MPDIDIRLLNAYAELSRAVELQQIYWGDDMGDLVPQHMLKSIATSGGHVVGAFDGDTMIGMLLGFLGTSVSLESDHPAAAGLHVMSKRMVVLPEYRGRKIGERLKLAQRQIARRQHIALVTWTFDPMLARNAYLNLHKLAGTGQDYVEDYFGAGASHPTLHADRIVVNWWVSHPQTVARLDEGTSPQTAADLQAAGIDVDALDEAVDAMAAPDDALLVVRPAMALLEIPPEFVPIERMAPDLSQRWRDHVRAAFQGLLADGYLACDVLRVDRRIFYVFRRDDGSYAFPDQMMNSHQE